MTDMRITSGNNSLTFESQGLKLAANLYTPDGFDREASYPAVIFTGPSNQVKEQTGAVYGANWRKRTVSRWFTTTPDTATARATSETSRTHLEDGGRPRRCELPRYPVVEGAGIIEAPGDGVPGLAIGDRVARDRSIARRAGRGRPSAPGGR